MKKRIIAATLGVPLLTVCIMALAVRQTPIKHVVSVPKTTTGRDQSPTPDPKSTPATTTRSILGFYTTYNAADKKSYRALEAYGSSLNEVATMTFNFTANGSVVGTAPTDGLSLAQTEHIKPFAAIANKTNDGFNSALGHRLLTDGSARRAAIAQTLRMVQLDGYRGVNLDLENLPAADRSAYASFVNDLAFALHQHGAQLIVSVMAKTSDQPKSAWVGAFDYAAIGKAADQVQLMTYDEHGPWDQPGSVASLPWVEQVLQYASAQIPAHKLLLGLAAYGYDWDLGNAKQNKAVAWKNVNALLAKTQAATKWDDIAQSPYFQYTAADGSHHVVWYENADSISAKTALVNRYQLAGIAMWHVGLEDQGFWQAVAKGLGQ